MVRCSLCRVEGHNRRICPQRSQFMDVIQEEQRVLAEKKARNALINKEKLRIQCSSLAYFPCLIDKRISLQEYMIENIELPRKYNYGYNNSDFPQSVRALQKIAYSMAHWKSWIHYIYINVFSSRHPISKLHIHFPLCFWVAMTRELRHIQNLMKKIKEDLPKLVSQEEEDITKVDNVQLTLTLFRLVKGRTKKISSFISRIEGYVIPQLKTSESILSRQLNLCNFEEILPFDLIPVVCSYL